MLEHFLDAAAVRAFLRADDDSPLTGTSTPLLYLGTPNTDAGKKAGEAMKTVLGGKGDVAILTGSLTAANALQRMSVPSDLRLMPRSEEKAPSRTFSSAYQGRGRAQAFARHSPWSSAREPAAPSLP